jgi:2-octaprenyl-6-methoxyphenol hydroxylase
VKQSVAHPQVLAHPLVIGGGPVGLVLALSLQQSGVPVTVLEAQPPGAMYGDGRALALSYGTRQVLEQLGVWERLATSVTAIATIHVSQQKGLGRALLKASEHQLPALGYVVSYGALMQALDARLAETAAGITVRYQVPVQHLHVDGAAAQVTLQSATLLSATAAEPEVLVTPLAVVADGGRSLEAIPGLIRDTKHYGHDALVGLVQTELPHRNIAYERFTPYGPMALLPNGEQFSLVWTGEQTYIDQISALDDAAFLQALHQAFGDRVGKFLHIGKRGRFPLKLSKLEQTFAAHCVVIGNAAQTMHPVAGQGFNVGIRDAMALANNIAASTAAEWGAAHRLSDYQQSRARDSGRGLLFTDFLVNVFSNDLIGVGLLRGAGLGALSLLPFARRFLVNKMSYGS